ncbi:hypothetical protein [Bordetella bronchialis]|uniref:Uncharacterized protein n=1 Tax=Bordetella bronchialis TaxID=463025 RepID=A0A193FFM3_9BORD|nr:hypothetical protein [Bordetella bronchialis]ANN66562.1 hypothetical protein BAU06_09870 [Bordetella bronchialis]ANN71640.1 hypothetical protein BAU08_10070 [Bordetella bronchialis]
MPKKKVTVTELSSILHDEFTMVAGGNVPAPPIERRDGCDPNWSVPVAKDSEFRAAVERVMAEYDLA